MAFTYTLDGKMLMPPSQKGMTTPSGRIDKVWGTWDGTAVVTGNLFTRESFSQVLSCCPHVDTSTPGSIQVELDQPAAGQARIGFTSGKSGSFVALVLTLGK